ncbi:MAG: hypothetical protein ACREDV_09360 [Methylocella sp.]
MTIQAMPKYDSISQQALVSLIGQVISGNPNPDDSSPPGPWGPVIRKALQQVLWRFGPGPEPWLQFGPRPEPWVQVALNPQPLPPRTLFFAAIAQEVIERASLIRETADALTSQGERQGIIIVGGYVSKFADEWCGNGRLKWPFPGPRPHWFPEERGGVDLIVTGVQFQRAASETFDGQLSQTFADAGAKIVQAGVAKLQ